MAAQQLASPYPLRSPKAMAVAATRQFNRLVDDASDPRVLIQDAIHAQPQSNFALLCGLMAAALVVN